jgi:hypothetical protein
MKKKCLLLMAFVSATLKAESPIDFAPAQMGNRWVYQFEKKTTTDAGPNRLLRRYLTAEVTRGPVDGDITGEPIIGDSLSLRLEFSPESLFFTGNSIEQGLRLDSVFPGFVEGITLGDETGEVRFTDQRLRAVNGPMILFHGHAAFFGNPFQIKTGADFSWVDYLSVPFIGRLEPNPIWQNAKEFLQLAGMGPIYSRECPNCGGFGGNTYTAILTHFNGNAVDAVSLLEAARNQHAVGVGSIRNRKVTQAGRAGMERYALDGRRLPPGRAFAMATKAHAKR